MKRSDAIKMLAGYMVEQLGEVSSDNYKQITIMADEYLSFVENNIGMMPPLESMDGTGFYALSQRKHIWDKE